MRSFLYFLGILLFPLGMHSLFLIFRQAVAGKAFLGIFGWIVPGIAMAFLGSIIWTAIKGWPQKELQSIGKMSIGLAIFQVVLGTFIGGKPLMSTFLGFPGGESWILILTLLVWLGGNIAAKFLFPKKPTRGMLAVWIGMNILFAVAIIFFTLQVTTDLGSQYVTVQVLSRMFTFGLLTAMIFRHFELKKQWEAYIETGSHEFPIDLKPTHQVPDAEKIKRLAHPQLLVRITAAETLRDSNSPLALGALAQGIEQAPFMYLFHEQRVASGWKALKFVSKQSLQTLKDQNKPFLDAFPHVYCMRDNRWAVREETPGGTPYVLCPVCQKHDLLKTGIHHVIGQIGNGGIEPAADTLKVRVWEEAFQCVNEADITELHIITDDPDLNPDWAASAFVQHFENNSRNKDRKIPVKIDHPEKLQSNTLAILQTIQAQPT